MTQVFVSIVEPILALFEMQVESAIGDSIEFLEPPLGITPETLNAVNVMLAAHKLVLPMMDSEMLGVANINQAIVAINAEDAKKEDAKDTKDSLVLIHIIYVAPPGLAMKWDLCTHDWRRGLLL